MSITSNTVSTLPALEAGGMEHSDNVNWDDLLTNPEIDSVLNQLSMSELKQGLMRAAGMLKREINQHERCKRLLLSDCVELSEAVEYAAGGLQERWPELEEQLLEQDAHDDQVVYAAQVIGGRWAEAEKSILADEEYFSGIDYAISVIKGRWPELEKALLQKKDVRTAVRYAASVIRGRWSDLELLVLTNIESVSCYLLYQYAKTVIQGKLPEQLHNLMIIKGMMDPNSMGFKTYTTAKKYQQVRKPR